MDGGQPPPMRHQLGQHPGSLVPFRRMALGNPSIGWFASSHDVLQVAPAENALTTWPLHSFVSLAVFQPQHPSDRRSAGPLLSWHHVDGIQGGGGLAAARTRDAAEAIAGAGAKRRRIF